MKKDYFRKLKKVNTKRKKRIQHQSDLGGQEGPQQVVAQQNRQAPALAHLQKVNVEVAWILQLCF